MQYKITTLILLIIGLLSCKNDLRPDLQSKTSADKYEHYASAGKAMLEEDESIEPPRTAQPAAPEFQLDKGSKIIKKGNMAFEVKDLNAVKSATDNIIKALDAYYEKETYSNSTYHSQYDLRIRIPFKNFESLITQLENGSGKLLVKNIKADDVTEQFVDLKIRLENNLAYVKRYTDLLHKANKIEDIMAIQEKIRYLESEIEAKKGRIKYINDRVRYSSLDLQLKQIEKPTLVASVKYNQKLWLAFKSGFIGFGEFVLTLVRNWPLLLFILIILILSSRLRYTLTHKIGKIWRK